MTVCAMCCRSATMKVHFVALRWADEKEPFKTVVMCDSCFQRRFDAGALD